ncbi:hypothetical protein [Actinoplanes sp. G11-F43]|uniref:hypothetical protein n=1 Tax=Actinoplanes sp. G11-F43 TaxID=3424130 RepID=UPI003D3590C5
MTAPGNGPLWFLLTLAVVVSSCYAVGRVHQWHRHGLDRDEAYRIGYDRASRSILGMTAQPDPGPSPARRIVNQRRLYPAREDTEAHEGAEGYEGTERYTVPHI